MIYMAQGGVIVMEKKTKYKKFFLCGHLLIIGSMMTWAMLSH